MLESGADLNQPGLFESGVSTILVDRLQCPAGKRQTHPAVFLRNPDALALQVGGYLAFDHFGNVTTDTALFLGET